ncbi:MAG: helix-turn-helix domain-containing protein [Actinobacteria bacterium]|nr:helix-turn-helix domain-containing protein [Actinomycetota bacterium]
MEWSRDPESGWTIRPPHTRIAVPNGSGFAVHEVHTDDFHAFRERVMDIVLSSLEGGVAQPPEVALRELIDNLVHAVPCSASLVVEPSRKRFYISDNGPGINRLDLAMEPGYSTATEAQRSVIRGVGLGFYLAQREISSLGGELNVFSQPGGGTYISVSISDMDVSPTIHNGMVEELSQRQNNILFLLTEEEFLGPSQVSAELGISLSTAHRELVRLERLGLVTRSSDGKRFLSDMGKSYLRSILSL